MGRLRSVCWRHQSCDFGENLYTRWFDFRRVHVYYGCVSACSAMAHSCLAHLQQSPDSAIVSLGGGSGQLTADYCLSTARGLLEMLASPHCHQPVDSSQDIWALSFTSI